MEMMKHQSEPAERVLNTADELFYRQGYSATGINQIIKEAGVARASFYQHFPSKRDLAIAYIQRRHEQWFRLLRDRLDQETDPKQRLLTIFDFLETWLPESDYRGCAFLNMASEFPVLGTDIHDVVSRHKLEMRSLIRDLTSKLRSDAVESTADTIHVLFEGAIVEAQVMRDTWPVQAAKKGVERMLAD